MKSEPYKNVLPEVEAVVRPLISTADEYHKVHEARLARTVDLVYRDLLSLENRSVRLLELGTMGLIPTALRELCPEVIVHGTHLDLGLPPITGVDFVFGEKQIRVLVACVDLESQPLPVADETYDYVLCCEVLEHMEIDPMYMLAEVNRAMKPGGKLFLTTPNVASSRGISKILRGWEPYFYMQYHRTRDYHRHNYEYSVHSLWRLLHAAGFDPTIWTEDLFEDGMFAVVEKLRLAGFDIHNVGDNILSISTKISEIIERWPDGIYD